MTIMTNGYSFSIRDCRRAAFMVSLLLCTRAASALDEGDKEAVRSLSNDAAADYQEGNYRRAQQKFQQAYRVARVPRLAVWLASTHEKLGQWVTAYELYREATTLQPNELWLGDLQQQAQKEADAESDRLLALIPKLTVQVDGANASEVSLTLDGSASQSALLGTARLVDPGPHEIVARRGTETVKEAFVVAERDHKLLTLRFAARLPIGRGAAQLANASSADSTDGASASAPYRTWGWVSAGVGGAGLTLGIVTGGLVAAKYGDLDDRCPDRVCAPEERAEVDSYGTLRTVSSVSFIAGGVIAAAGVTLLLTSRARATEPHVALWVSPIGAGLRGGF
ncbi:MAG TPA: hypothetical protein VER33_22220 [Polyangiaceae bacterium]|nr:hypothetical protein [Polyangiaceae bacterium]